MDSSLESVLSEQATETTTTETTEQTTETTNATETKQEAATETTGEQESATPAEQHKDDPLDKASQGLKAAAVAERQKRQDAERRAQEAAQRAQVLEQQLHALQRPQQKQEQGEDAKPLRSQFQTEDEWLDARDAWRDRQTEKATQEHQARERLTFLQRTAEETVKRGQEQFSDFDAVINAGLGPVLTPVLQQTLFLSERGHEVAYFLGKNPQEAQRVARMPPLMLARELAFIEAKLTAPQETRRELPETLTQARNAKGQFQDAAYSGPTPLDAILATKR